MKIVERAARFSSRTAIISAGQSYSYDGLLDASATIAANLLPDRLDLNEQRICFLIAPSFEYTALQWGIWRAGGIAVPLCVLHPIPSLRHVVVDTGASIIITDENYKDFLTPLAEECDISLVLLKNLLKETDVSLPTISSDRRAMILYTSGTTSKPKGVVTNHRHIEAQITTLVDAWEWNEDDRILNVLPLHHVHGIINAMSCALWVGACCEFLPRFDAALVWERIRSGELSLFMGVPTMYFRLINYWEAAIPVEQKKLSEASLKMRLMVSGSAALPVSVLENWQEITGHILLERYGMTEIGMGLTNSYRGERRPGHVGLPFDKVQLKLVNSEYDEVNAGEIGEILIKGPSVFEEYWNNPKATNKAFTEDGWFKTGDMAVLNEGSYKILGRDSVDIIKSGGFKISALEIEDVLRKHPNVKDCAVVGLQDEEWGEIVAASIVSDQTAIDFKLLTSWLRKYLPAYKLPKKYLLLDELPRNVLGKVTKPAVKAGFNH